jgi:prepilin-type N-terminal cleavage/methylation domain-containing protein
LRDAMTLRRKQLGLSLIEMMVSLTLGLSGLWG